MVSRVLGLVRDFVGTQFPAPVVRRGVFRHRFRAGVHGSEGNPQPRRAARTDGPHRRHPGWGADAGHRAGADLRAAAGLGLLKRR
ncbi:hypothetical protein G6F35_018767 [Rhizopus arrhizus]|nr:hypothetical protein G6F35_018767 [Rhizopus arrhizus]